MKKAKNLPHYTETMALERKTFTRIDENTNTIFWLEQDIPLIMF